MNNPFYQSHYLRCFLYVSVIALTTFTSCGSKKFQRTIETEAFTLKLIGKKSTSLDPYEIGLVLTNKKNNKDLTLQLEVYANDLNDQNPSFTKKDDHRYVLVFTQSDDTKRELILTVTEDEVLIEEVL